MYDRPSTQASPPHFRRNLVGGSSGPDRYGLHVGRSLRGRLPSFATCLKSNGLPAARPFSTKTGMTDGRHSTSMRWFPATTASPPPARTATFSRNPPSGAAPSGSKLAAILTLPVAWPAISEPVGSLLSSRSRFTLSTPVIGGFTACMQAHPSAFSRFVESHRIQDCKSLDADSLAPDRLPALLPILPLPSTAAVRRIPQRFATGGTLFVIFESPPRPLYRLPRPGPPAPSSATTRAPWRLRTAALPILDPADGARTRQYDPACSPHRRLSLVTAS